MGRGDKWTKEEESSVIRQIDTLHLKPHQVFVDGRTQRAIDHKISDLRARGLLKTSFYIEWTDEEDGDLLIQIGMQLRNLNQIKIPGRTEQAIYTRIKKLRKKGFVIKIVKSLRPQQIKAHIQRKKVMDRKKEIQNNLSKLKNVLKGVGRHWPSEVVAGVLLCKADWVSRWRKRWKLQLHHKTALRDSVYRKNFHAQVALRSGKIKDQEVLDISLKECISDAYALLPEVKAEARRVERQKKLEIYKKHREEKEKAKQAEVEARNVQRVQDAIIQKCESEKEKLDDDLKDFPSIRKPVISETRYPSSLNAERERNYQHKLRLGTLEERFRSFSNCNCMDQLVQCSRCRTRWYFNTAFFSVTRQGRELLLTDVCNACVIIE